jgi:rhodanese-related sulfurtransferase
MQQHPDALVLDTRMIEKYERNRIPGATAAPYTEVLEAITDTLQNDRRLLVYCGHDERSTYVCRMLTKEMGFVNVYRLKGGLRRWEKENLPLDTSAVRTGLE